jgi:hypothetical protein
LRRKTVKYNLESAAAVGTLTDSNLADREADFPFLPDASTPPVEGIRLGELVEKFIEEKKAGWTFSTHKSHSRALRQLLAILGRDFPVRSVTREKMLYVRDVLYDLPRFYTRNTEGRTIEEIAAKARLENAN